MPPSRRRWRRTKRADLARRARDFAARTGFTYDRAEWDGVVYRTVSQWLVDVWPFEAGRVVYAAR